MTEKVNEYIDQAIKHGQIGPEAIAEYVAKQLSDQEKFELVVNLLHNAVRDRLRQMRTIPDVNPRHVRTVNQSGRARVNTRYGNPSDRLNHILSGQFYTTDGWKELRNMTYDDLMFAAKWRRTQADALNTEADRLERLAQLLQAADKPTVGSLPAGLLLRT